MGQVFLFLLSPLRKLRDDNSSRSFEPLFLGLNVSDVREDVDAGVDYCAGVEFLENGEAVISQP